MIHDINSNIYDDPAVYVPKRDPRECRVVDNIRDEKLHKSELPHPPDPDDILDDLVRDYVAGHLPGAGGGDVAGQLEIINSDEYALAICDREGNIVLALDHEGKLVVADLDAHNLGGDVTVQVNGPTSWLTGKHCYVLGDSLSADTSATGSWHQKFCQLTGAILDANLNRGYLSAGSTATVGTHTDSLPCAHIRAKRLVEHYNKGEHPVDVIFLQNVNDINNNVYSAGINSKGDKTNLPFFENQQIVYSENILTTSSPSTDVFNYFQENIDSILAGVEPMLGTVVDMTYTKGSTTAKELKITSAPTKDGDITITLKHGANYRAEVFNISVKAGMSIKEVVAMILDTHYKDVGDYDDIEGANGDSVIFSSPYSLEFSGGDTGVKGTITNTSALLRYPIAFIGKDIHRFKDPSQWIRESHVSYWSAQKGLVEYLQTNIPTAKIFYLILPYFKVTYPIQNQCVVAFGIGDNPESSFTTGATLQVSALSAINSASTTGKFTIKSVGNGKVYTTTACTFDTSKFSSTDTFTATVTPSGGSATALSHNLTGSYAHSDYLREDGSFNMEYWDTTGRGSKNAIALYEEQVQVAKYYNLDVIDVASTSTCNPTNISSYYPSNNVHPSTSGYNLWGEVIARILSGN